MSPLRLPLLLKVADEVSAPGHVRARVQAIRCVLILHGGTISVKTIKVIDALGRIHFTESSRIALIVLLRLFKDKLDSLFGFGIECIYSCLLILDALQEVLALYQSLLTRLCIRIELIFTILVEPWRLSRILIRMLIHRRDLLYLWHHAFLLLKNLRYLIKLHRFLIL